MNSVHVEAFLICYNEERMIRHTLNHYSTFCKKITIYDNGSTDRSIKLAKEYPCVEIKTFDTGNSFNDREHLKIKNHCWKGSSADFVIVSDMDELLFSNDLQADLLKLKKQQVSYPTVTGYNMYCETFPSDYSKPIFDQVKTGVRATHFDKQIIFNPKKIKEMNYMPGCHNAFPVGHIVMNQRVPLKLLHYKYLDADAVSKKHLQYSARLSLYNINNQYGMEYRDAKMVPEFFEILKEKAKAVI